MRNNQDLLNTIVVWRDCEIFLSEALFPTNDLDFEKMVDLVCSRLEKHDTQLIKAIPLRNKPQ